MAGKCDGDWFSKINGSDDGTIEIHENTKGELSGKHKKSDKNILGQCTEAAVPHISFARIGADGCFYIYDGDIKEVTVPVPTFVIENGKVSKVCGPITERAAPAVSDDWTAEKTT